jgi:hypothetical protein
MVASLGAPGVYVREVPSGSRAITAVSTSVAAFLGRARRGPVNRPTAVLDPSAFERSFGGLWRGSELGLLVQDFFQHGGSVAQVVRVYAPLYGPGEHAAALAVAAAIRDAVIAAGPDVQALLTAAANAAAAVPPQPVLSRQAATRMAAAVSAGAAGLAPASAQAADLERVRAAARAAVAEAAPLTHAALTLSALDFGRALYAAWTVVRAADAVADAQARQAALDAAALVNQPASARAAVALLAAAAQATPSDAAVKGAVRGAVSGDAQVQARLTSGFAAADAAVMAAAAPGATADAVRQAAAQAAQGAGASAQAVADAANLAAQDPLATAGRVAEAALAALGRVVTLAEALAGAGWAALRWDAADPGRFGGQLVVEVDTDVSPEVAQQMGVATSALFNVTVRDGGSGAEERFRNLTVVDGPRRVDAVLAESSALIRLAATPAQVPVAGRFEAAPGAEGHDGWALGAADMQGSLSAKTGLYALEHLDLFNLLVVAPHDFSQAPSGDVDPAVWSAAAAYCKARRAVLLVDPPSGWRGASDALSNLSTLGIAARDHAALYFPRLVKADPRWANEPRARVPSGAVAGLYAAQDAGRGVWTAPAGLGAGLGGVVALDVAVSEGDVGRLNPMGVNALCKRPAAGHVVWGARTLAGADQLASDWKYVPVRRLALFIEESLFRGLRWAVFEPNGPSLWGQLRGDVRAFMADLFRRGAFRGKAPDEAFLVRCDGETTSELDRARGVVNVVVGFAPVRPAEFIFVYITQMAGPAER